jgi:hypothetical protein
MTVFFHIENLFYDLIVSYWPLKKNADLCLILVQIEIAPDEGKSQSK